MWRPTGIKVATSRIADARVTRRNMWAPNFASVFCLKQRDFGNSPDSVDAVLIKFRVAGDDGSVLQLGLGDQNSIERISVMRRQESGSDGVFCQDRKLDESFLVELLLKIFDQVWRFKFSRVMFDRNFPKRTRRNKDLIGGIFNHFACAVRQATIVLKPPQEGV